MAVLMTLNKVPRSRGSSFTAMDSRNSTAFLDASMYECAIVSG